MKKHLKIYVTGKVQDVWFRDTAKKEADKLGIVGNVRNELDRSVLIHAQGGEEVLKQFLAWCHDGPGHAQVDGVEQEELPPINYQSFETLGE